MSGSITPEQEEGRKPGRPRSSEAHQAILQTTLRLLAELGFQALSIEQIASQAAVGKMTIYRRWPSKEALVREAIQSIQATMPVMETGNLRDDLISMYRTALQTIQENPQIKPLYLRLLSEWAAQPELFQVFLAELILPRFQQFVQKVEVARARGDIRSDIRQELVIDLLIGPVLFRWLATPILHPTDPLDPGHYAQEIADLLLGYLAVQAE